MPPKVISTVYIRSSEVVTPTLEAFRLPDTDLKPVPWALMLKPEALARALPALSDRDNKAGMRWRREEGSIMTQELKEKKGSRGREGEEDRGKGLETVDDRYTRRLRVL